MLRRTLLITATVLFALALAAFRPVRSPSRAVGAAQSPSAQRGHEKQGQGSGRVQAYTLPPGKYRQAIEYARARYRAYPLDVLWGFLVLAGMLRWRLGPRYRDWAERASHRRFVQAWIFAPLVAVTVEVLELPFDIYSHHLSLKYGQSVQGWASWSADWGKSLTLTLLIAGFLAWLLYAVIRRAPGRWWLYFWFASIPIVIFLLYVQPLVVDPLFYKFEPLEKTDPALVQEFRVVAHRAGIDIPASRMFEMEASAKLRSLNAYVAGVGASKRVVVWDTAIARLTVPQIAFVFAHELGHYVLRHIRKGIAFGIAALFVVFYLSFRLLRWAVGRWGRRWGIQGVPDWASLPLLLLILDVFTFLGAPVANGFSRYMEHQADVYALEVTHGIIPDSTQVGIQTFQIMGEVDLSDPNPPPLVELWLYTHPSINERIGFALHYDPWRKGKRGQFVR